MLVPLLLGPWILARSRHLRRGKWMSKDHDQHYGKTFKFKGLQWWSGSGTLVKALRKAARKDLDV